MAIGSAPEINKQFRTGNDNIYYPWIVNGEQKQLMHGEAELKYARSLGGKNILPPEGTEWSYGDTGDA